jgi:hypothetical protein
MAKLHDLVCVMVALLLVPMVGNPLTAQKLALNRILSLPNSRAEVRFLPPAFITIQFVDLVESPDIHEKLSHNQAPDRLRDSSAIDRVPNHLM